MRAHKWIATFLVTGVLTMASPGVRAAEFKLDETPAGDGEWGYRPAQDEVVEVTPPGFVWRPQGAATTYRLQIARTPEFRGGTYDVDGIDLAVHCPAGTLDPGVYYWRYRAKKGADVSNWSTVRRFEVAKAAKSMPLPDRKTLLSRVPDGHPRLFVRPERIGRLRELAQGDLKEMYDDLVAECERIMANPPNTKEPPKYPDGMKRGSDPWRKIWWGNRDYTIRALNGAATLAFTRLLGGQEHYGQEARRILMECAKWDPKGATGYRYNDEAGMPYAYYFARAYTFVNDLLSDTDKAILHEVAKIRGEEMYRHLFPRHLWRPYASHSNRAWHFLGELGVAFHGEVEGAEDWVWFATNVFYSVYPAWSDTDGGWHEGSAYWSGYQGRFTWWADVMRVALGLNAYDKPYYARVGYYMLYLMPPGKVGGGFGDLCASRSAAGYRSLVATFASQARNGYWQWWVDANGGVKGAGGGYIGFIRGALPSVEPVEPIDLPASRVFRGTGQAYLNTTIVNAEDNVQVVFKASPFGTQSHGYEANNSFLLHAWNKRVLIRSGKRDSYGSDHHRNWMWSTRSVNNITVNGEGQFRRSSSAKARIVDFATTPALDVVAGEAGQAYAKIVERNARGYPTKYEPILDRFTRTIVFAKPDLVVVFDRIKAREASTFEYRLHALNEFEATDQHAILARVDDVRCHIDLMAPKNLALEQTDQYDPNPRPRIALREWHLTAVTPGKRKDAAFVATYRLVKGAAEPVRDATLEELPGGYLLRAKVTDGELTALLPTDDEAELIAGELRTQGLVKARLVRGDETTELECAQR